LKVLHKLLDLISVNVDLSETGCRRYGLHFCQRSVIIGRVVVIGAVVIRRGVVIGTVVV
jgi:hypothetical protein